MADAVPSEKLRQYLRELKPEARALLATELERALLRGEEPPGAALILEQLRSEARSGGRKLPRPGNPQRLFFLPLEPFLVDDAPERKHRGRVARACLDPVWNWLCRDLAPQDARTYVEQVTILIGANEKKGAEQVARAFQDLIESRMREALIALKGDDKARRQIEFRIGMPNAIEHLRETAAILRIRDALGVIASRLPQSISNLADEQLENVKNLLESPVGRHRDVFLHALLMVMSRLGSPWQLIRLPIMAAGTDVAARVAETPYAVAVDIILADMERMSTHLRDSLKAGRRDDLAEILKEIHDAARALRAEMDLSGDSAWARQLAALRAEVSRVLQAEIDNLPGAVRRVLRPRSPKELRGDSAVDAAEVEEIEGKLELAATCRNYASELAISEATRRIHSDLQNYFDTGTQALLDRLRASPAAERSFRQSQLDAAVRFCAKLFGADYAGTLAKAADVAAKGEQKAAKA
jgi:hypothetical protein